MLPGMIITPVANADPATVAFITSAISASDLTTYTFSSVSLGTADANRIIIVNIAACAASSGRTISSVTVAGITATQQVFQSAFSTASAESAIYTAAVPTGTTGNIVVTWSAGMLRCGIGVYGSNTMMSATATATGSSTANPANASINVSAGGFVVGCDTTYRTSGAPTFTWTNLTENYDQNIEAGGTSQTGASSNFSTAQTGLSITCTPSLFTAGSMCIAAFR